MDWKKSFPYERHTVHVGDYAFSVTDEGSGNPILLVHGNPTWSYMWRAVIAEFKNDHRMIAIDHLGCGFSDKPPRAYYNLASHGDNLSCLIRDLDLQEITLVAHDWGGAIGLYAAAMKEPERFKRIVLLNTGAFPPPRVPWRIAACRIPILGELAIRGFNLFLEAAFRMALEHPQRLSDTDRSAFRAPYDSWQDRIGIARFVQDIPMSSRHPTYAKLVQLEQSLGRLRQLPICLIWGMRDWCFTPKCLERFRTHWPEAKVVQLEDAGHWVLEDSSADVLRAMRAFFQDHPLADRGTQASAARAGFPIAR